MPYPLPINKEMGLPPFPVVLQDPIDMLKAFDSMGGAARGVDAVWFDAGHLEGIALSHYLSVVAPAPTALALPLHLDSPVDCCFS
jgi:hypothetical protein